MVRLAQLLKPCGPVADEPAAGRLFEVLEKAALAGGWADLLAQARPALAPVFGASPYLASLARRRPHSRRAILDSDPAQRLNAVLAHTAAAAEADLAAAPKTLRDLKADLHLLAALCDLGGVWGLDEVTGALTRFADEALKSALCLAARGEVERGGLTAVGSGATGPVPGLF